LSDPGASFITVLDVIMYTVPAASTATSCSPELKVSPELSVVDGNRVQLFEPGASLSKQLSRVRPRLQLA
jgi:hypothetical protein